MKWTIDYSAINTRSKMRDGGQIERDNEDDVWQAFREEELFIKRYGLVIDAAILIKPDGTQQRIK